MSALALKRWVAMRQALVGDRPDVGDVRYRWTVRRSGRVAWAGKGAVIHARPDNDAVERTIASHPGRFVGWFCVNPNAGIGADEVERRLARPGWIGVKAHPFWHQYPVQALDPIAEVCQARGRPMLVHLGAPGDRGDFRRLPDRFPRLPVVYAHALIPWYAAPGRRPAVARTSSWISPAPTSTGRSGTRRCGSWAPGAACTGATVRTVTRPDGGYDHRAILEQIERFGMTPQELDRVLGGNFLAITAA